MHTVLIFSGGRRVDALILSAWPDRLRVVMPGRSETAELRMVDGRWKFENGDRVEIGALMVCEGMGPAHFVPRTDVRTFSAS